MDQHLRSLRVDEMNNDYLNMLRREGKKVVDGYAMTKYITNTLYKDVTGADSKYGIFKLGMGVSVDYPTGTFTNALTRRYIEKGKFKK